MDKYLTEAQLSEMLSVSRRTLRRWREVGVGPAYVQAGKVSIRYPADKVREYLDSQTVDCDEQGSGPSQNG